MRFDSWIADGCFFIRGEFVPEHGDVKVGPRYQGPFDELEMVNDTVWYNYIPKKLHPDELAIMCFMIFFPWVGKKIEFPDRSRLRFWKQSTIQLLIASKVILKS